eukprot:4074448-Prymnesium_polylepis.1
MGIAYTHWQPWNPGQGLSGHGCSQRAARDLPPHGNRDASFPPHALGVAPEDRQHPPDRCARS